MNYVQYLYKKKLFRRFSGELKQIMATSAATTDVVPDVDYPETFGGVLDGELGPEISSDFQEQAATPKKEAAKKADNDGVENQKSALLISAAVVAVIGVVYAVVRKIK